MADSAARMRLLSALSAAMRHARGAGAKVPAAGVNRAQADTEGERVSETRIPLSSLTRLHEPAPFRRAMGADGSRLFTASVSS